MTAGTSTNCLGRRLLLVVFGGMYLSLAAILSMNVVAFYKLQDIQGDLPDDCNLLQRFPGYFVDDFKQKMYDEDIPLDKAIHHGCCLTVIKFKHFANTTVLCGGQNRTLATFNDFHQFFQYDDCSVSSNCQNSVCSCENELRTAVYDTGSGTCSERYGICTFTMEGCCKCVAQQ